MKESKKRLVNASDFRQDPNYVPADMEKAKLIKKLALMVTDRGDALVKRKITYDDPEYWFFDRLLNKEQLEFLVTFKSRRIWHFIEEIAENNKMSIEEAEKMIDRLAYLGFIEYTRENPERKRQYCIPMFVPGIAEYMVMNPNIVKEYPEICTFFNLMSQVPLEPVTPMVPLGGAGIGMHVIPVETAIDAENKSVSVEHISHWLKKYDKFAVGYCSCRIQQEMRGEGDGSVPGEFCVVVGDMAEYGVETKRARYITYDEAMEIFERAEREGFVHQLTNIDGEDKIVAICNCAPGVCNAIRTSQLFNTPNLSRSAYRAHVDRDKCVACGKCVEVCPVGAAKLGQKLCGANGPVQYPSTLLPDETSWGEEHWNPNYRDTAKINCYDSGTAPCKTACPAHIAVQGYIQMAKEGRYMEALKLIKQDNPLPAVCGAICNRRCEAACTRGTIDAPLAVDEIKKFISALELEADKRYIPVCENPEGKQWDEFPIAIVGAGPAGISCAYYLRSKGYPVTVFEKEGRPGGMLMNGIPTFRLEKDIVMAEIDILKEMGVEFKYNVEVGKDITLSDLRAQGYRAFFVGIGAQGGRMLGLENEDAQGVETGVSFLRRVNQDNTITLDGDVVVIGGGNVAVDVARSAMRTTNGKVTMLCLESEKEMPADPMEVEEAIEEGISVNCGWGPSKIIEKDGKVTGIVFKKCKSVFDEAGKFNPVYDEEDTLTIECSNVLLSVGQTIEWGNLLEGTDAEFNRNNTVKADSVTLQTGCKDVFVGGDAYTGPSFAIDAIASGKNAAESIHRYVHKGQSLTIARDLREFKQFDTSVVRVDSFDTSSRQEPGRKNLDHKSFRDNREVFTEEQVQKEASRCLECGMSIVDLNRCIGCGLCTTKCEFDAIHLERDLPDASRMLPNEQKMKFVAPYMAKRAMKIAFKKSK